MAPTWQHTASTPETWSISGSFGNATVAFSASSMDWCVLVSDSTDHSLLTFLRTLPDAQRWAEGALGLNAGTNQP